MNKMKLQKKQKYKIEGFYLNKFDKLSKEIKIHIDNMDFGCANRTTLQLRHYIEKMKEEKKLEEK